MQGTCIHERRAASKERVFFWTSVHLACLLGDGLDLSLVHMEVSGRVSASCDWQGEAMFLRQQKGELDLD